MGGLGRAGVPGCSGHVGLAGEKQESFKQMFSLVIIDNDLCMSYYEVRIPTATPPSNEDKEPLEEVLAFDTEDLNANLKSRSFSVDF